MKTGLMLGLVAICAASAAGRAPSPTALEDARNRQDRAALEKIVSELAGPAQKQPDDAAGQYRLAQAESYLAEVAFELRDKTAAKTAAEAGIRAAERAASLKPQAAEYHRLLGTLCGQIIPSNVLLALRYGKCARESIDKAIQLDPKLAQAYVSRGVGNYYLPPAFGGSIEAAIRDFEKAIQVDPRSADAHLWLGIALRKVGRNADARKAIARSLELNPNRIWAKQQLEKTPAP
ncbi:MAG: tetratricopeptide repeat protein [Acidobacteria bacterium]|nr:tetratricopeptide repeat protein [Acidobacteriota bacterium]